MAAMIKLIIWDLDDTLWQGTLADGDDVVPFKHRMDMIRAFNARGVLQSICSKNDFETAKVRLEALGLWDEFVFPHINFSPKSQAIREMVEDMQLRTANVLFVDDNPVNLNEVRFALPDVTVLDITRDDADAWLASLLTQQTGTRSRVADYRVLEAKKRDRSADASLSNEEFLRSCEIKVCAPFAMELLEHVDRIAEMINRSNQLNYTKSRVDVEDLRNDIIDVLSHLSLAVFAWDKYGNYGLIGFAMVKVVFGDAETSFDLKHFVFSCRAMHMGMEQFALDDLRQRIAKSFGHDTRLDDPSIAGRFPRTPSDWIEALPVRDEVAIAKMKPDQGAAEPTIRVMYSCQSGGIAHFSALRSIIAPDSQPKVFALRTFYDMTYDPAQFPPYLVYGAGNDYCDPAWDDLAQVLDYDLFASCVERFCRFVVSRGIEVLVLLPSENLKSEQYPCAIGATRERVARFNTVWRAAFDAYSGLSVAEIELLHGPEEQTDINHHHPGALQKIAQLVDYWHAQVTAAKAEAGDENLAA
jgi:FkbH-like protein